jgi:hypothetical protein
LTSIEKQIDNFGCVISGQVVLIAELLDQVEFVHGVDLGRWLLNSLDLNRILIDSQLSVKKYQ